MFRSLYRMENIVTAYKTAIQNHGHKVVELEFRLGRRGPGGSFCPGVSKTEFDRLRSVLNASKHFSREDVSTHERLNGTDARYIVINGDEASGKWLYKKKVCTDRASDTVRGSVAIEGVSHEPPPPGSPPFLYFRSKERTRFRWQCWSVDLTSVRSNLPQHADSDSDIYEVEIEFVDPAALFEYTLEYIVRWGIHLAQEIEALCKENK